MKTAQVRAYSRTATNRSVDLFEDLLRVEIESDPVGGILWLVRLDRVPSEGRGYLYLTHEGGYTAAIATIACDWGGFVGDRIEKLEIMPPASRVLRRNIRRIAEAVLAEIVRLVGPLPEVYPCGVRINGAPCGGRVARDEYDGLLTCNRCGSN